MTLKQFWSEFKTICKPPRPLKSSKMHGSGIKNQKKQFSHLDSENDPKKLQKTAPIGPPESIQNPPKTVLEFNSKIWWKTEAENTELKVQNGWFFWRFWLLKSTSKGTWSPAARQNWKFMKKGTQKYYKSILIVLISSLKLTNMKNSKHPKKQYQNPCDFDWVKLPSPLNGLAVCAERLNKK